MTTYCTIEEAYKVPSFDTPARKKKMAPACPSGSAAALGSSAGTVGFNPYGERAAVPQAPVQAAQGGRNPYGLLEYNEGFANMQQQTSTSYAGAVQDADYMCRAYNICGPAVAPPQKVTSTYSPPVIQPFQNPPQVPGSQYMQEYLAYTGKGRVPVVTEGFSAAPPPPSCPAPLSPPAYTVPVPPEAKAQAAKAMSASLSQPQGPTGAASTGPIQGFYDEDLEQYLSTQPAPSAGTYVPYSPGYAGKTPLNVQTVLNAPKAQGPSNTPDALSTGSLPSAEVLVVEGAASKNPAAVVPDVSSFRTPVSPPYAVSETTPAHPVLDAPAPATTPRSFYEAGWDLLLFVLAGVLVIFLLEQLFKLAMMVGMKRTIDIIRPYLRDLE